MKNVPFLCLITLCLPLLHGLTASAADQTHTVVASSAAVSGANTQPTVRGTFLGVSVAPVDPALGAQLRLPDGQGLLVMHVAPGSPAETVGIQRHDILLKLDEQILIDPHQLSVLVAGCKAGDQVSLLLVSKGEQQRVAAVLKEGDLSQASLDWQGQDVTAPFTPVPYRRWAFYGSPDFVWHSASPPEGGPQTSTGFHVAGSAEELRNVPVPPVPPIGFPVFTRSPGEGHVMVFHPQADVVFVDDAGSMTIQIDAGERVLIAKDVDGTEVFRGPIGAPEERANLPDELRKRLEKLEAMKVIDYEAPPPFDIHRGSPMPPPPEHP